jgi:hypothetical protein
VLLGLPIVTKSIENALGPLPKFSVMVWAEEMVVREARTNRNWNDLLIY